MSGDDRSLGFSYRARKSGEVEISRHGRVVTVLRSGAASSFLADAAACTPAQAQQLMARATGNYKRGNERSEGRGPRS